MNWSKDAITRRLRLLAQGLEVPMADLAERCAEAWFGRHGLEQALADGIFAIPHCHLVAAVDRRGVQVSGNVTLRGVSAMGRGQDRARLVRPYLLGLDLETLQLSDVSISRVTGQTCLTALSAVRGDGHMLGLLAADFDLRALPGAGPGPSPHAGRRHERNSLVD